MNIVLDLCVFLRFFHCMFHGSFQWKLADIAIKLTGLPWANQSNSQIDVGHDTSFKFSHILYLFAWFYRVLHAFSHLLSSCSLEQGRTTHCEVTFSQMQQAFTGLQEMLWWLVSSSWLLGHASMLLFSSAVYCNCTHLFPLISEHAALGNHQTGLQVQRYCFILL